MAIPYEPIVQEDLNLGVGTVDVSMPGGGTATGTKIGLHTFAEIYHVALFGLVGDGVFDNTQAFDDMVALLASFQGGSPTILFGPHTYRFGSRPRAIPTGIRLEGNGSVGSTDKYGTRLLADYAEATATNGFLTWDGSLSNGFAGVGGGIRNCQIYRSSNFSGGTAIKFTGADDNHRTGFNHVENVLIATSGSSTWNKGIVVDGTGLYTAGTPGIRTLYLSAVDITSCSDVDSNLWLFNAIHVHAVQMHLFPGTSAACGISVNGNASGPSTNVFFASCNIDGNVAIDYCNDFVWHGRIGGNFSVTANSNNISVIGGIHGTVDVAHSASVQLYLDNKAYLQQLVPIFNVDFPLLSGILTIPRVAGEGEDLLRAAALAGATAAPVGFSTTPTTGAGSAYLGYNQNQNKADNNATYFRAGFPAFRIGNPLGNGTYPWWLYVAAAGAAAGDPVVYAVAAKAKGSTGVVEFPAGIVAGDSAGFALDAFQVLTATSVVDPGVINDNAATTANLTVTGAVAGDVAIASFTGITTDNWIVSAHVSGVGNVKITLTNKTGAAVDLPSGTLRAVVIHKV